MPNSIVRGSLRCLADWGPDADLPVLASELQFFDFHLKHLDNGFTAQPPVETVVFSRLTQSLPLLVSWTSQSSPQSMDWP
ncbi:MAG: hypothetical protein ABFS30_15230 [Pseudomonadota bacterium]